MTYIGLGLPPLGLPLTKPKSKVATCWNVGTFTLVVAPGGVVVMG